MRPYLEMVEMGLKLQNLKEISELLKNAFETIDSMKVKGESWIEEFETSSYEDITQFITDKTLEVLKKCLSMASSQTEALTAVASLTKQESKEKHNDTLKMTNTCTNVSLYQSVSEKCFQLKLNETSQNKKIQKLKQRLKSQLEVTKCLKEKLESKGNEIQNMDTKMDEFKEEVMNELECASNVMSQLQSQCVSLSDQLEAKKENEEIQNKKTEVLKTDIISQTQDYISKSTEAIVQQQEELNTKIEIVRKNHDSFAKCSTRLESLEKEMKKWKEISESKHKQVEQTIDVRNNGTDTLDKVVKKITTLEAQLITITELSARVESLEKEMMKLNGISEMKQKHGQQTLDMKKEKVKSGRHDQATGQSGVNCIEYSQLNIGHHEQQISKLGEADLFRHLANCQKNPDHANFIPIKTFSIKHLPQAHQNPDMYAFIRAASNLTVRISVTKTSQDRPTCWPNTNVPYFLNDMRGRDCLRTGTGMVVKVTKSNTEAFHVTVQTATSVVFDLLEAESMTVRLLYDAEDSPEVILKYLNCSINKDVHEDTCFIDLETHDDEIVAKLRSLVIWYDALFQKVNKSANNDDFMFIVSHPHGCSKQISVGQRLDRLTSKHSPDKITYLTSTCPGSSGAIVHCIGFTNMNHTGCLQSGQNYSSYRGSFDRCA